jgi:hypothetical protein
MKIGLRVLILTILFVACKKNTAPVSLSGIYTEIAPNPRNTVLNFINGQTVIITGGQLFNSSYRATDTNQYQISNLRILFIADSSGKKDSTILWLQFFGSDSLSLNPCSPGIPCFMSEPTFFLKNN